MEAQAAVTSMSSILVNPRSSTSFHHKPIRVTMTSTPTTSTSYKDSVDSDIDSHLKQIVTIRPPFEVFKPMHHLIFSAPKNIAPALCIASCEAVGGHRNDALPAAAALHLMHVSAVAHENLLLGNTGHKKKYSFGQNIELMTGDGVVPLGFELIASAGHNRNDEEYADRVMKVIVEISRAVGSQRLVNAQYRKYVLDRSEQNGAVCNSISSEGDFGECGAACGAILGGGSEEKIEMLRRCGMFVGMMNEKLNANSEVETLVELRDLAMKELEGMDAGEIKFISSLMDSVFGL